MSPYPERIDKDPSLQGDGFFVASEPRKTDLNGKCLPIATAVPKMLTDTHVGLESYFSMVIFLLKFH